MADNRYCVEYAKRGMAACKKCKEKIEKGLLRIGKIVPNPFSENPGEMKMWYHVPCMFEQLSRARATTKKIESYEDLEGWEDIKDEDKEELLKHIICTPSRSGKIIKQETNTPKKQKPPLKLLDSPEESTSFTATSEESIQSAKDSKDNSFREFRRLCADIANEASYNEKTRIMERFFRNGTSGNGFEGDLLLWVKMLCPGTFRRIYNLQSKQLVKLFSEIFATDQDKMIADLEQGDVAETIRVFFEQSEKCSPVKKSNLSIHEVDRLLKELSSVTKETHQKKVLHKIANQCTSNDLKMIIRLIKHDLRINAGPKHVLLALHPDAYKTFQASRDFKDVLDRIIECRKGGRPLLAKALLMTPVLPMLAEACRSIDYAFKKCPNGMYAEIKYDGERVQVHKQGDTFKYFSRSLKPVLDYKVAHLKEYIPKAFPHGNDLILDSEVLLVDTKTSKPLPFGTLGVHKKAAFKDANVCLFVFDCIRYNAENLMNRPLKERRKILHENMIEIPNRIMFSEMKLIKEKEELRERIVSVIRQGLEGLVLKDVKGIYDPGKRHWLKVKKDYLDSGSMADSADLVVLGAYFGTGNKGGMMSVFLMGCYDPYSQKWYTVSKVHGGHDDATLERLQKELKMVKIKKDPAKVPDWLKVNRSLVPDFVCQDPKESQVWEITGAEFSKAEAHTADGISIRFPRVTRIRDDKNWKTATNLIELKELFKKSRETWDLPPISRSEQDLGEANITIEDDDSLEAVVKTESPDTVMQTESPDAIVKTESPDAVVKTDSPDTIVKSESPSSNGNTSLNSSREEKSPKKGHGRKRKESSSADASTHHSEKEERSPKRVKTSPQRSASEDVKRDESISGPKCIFPSVFRGVKIIIPETVHDYDLLRRYVIAYDGDVLGIQEADNATHVVIDGELKDKDKFSNLCQVTVDWLWDSIKVQRRRPTRQYSPGS